MAMMKSYLTHSPSVSPEAYVAETAVLIGKVTVDADTNIWDGVVIRGDANPITIGKGVSIQENTVIHVGPGAGEETVIGDYSLIGHCALVHGCKIESNCLIGMGAIIMNRASIKENSIVGAGSLVTEGKEYPPGSLIMGSPAKVVRELREDEMIKVRNDIMNYITLSKEHKNGTV